MLLHEKMRRSGSHLFRRRSFVLLVFLPLIVLAISRAEPLERQFGDRVGDLYEVACLALVVAGLALRAFTVGYAPRGTSGRNTERQVASTLNTSGMYSLSRNPLYLANSMVYLGVILSTQDLMLALVVAMFLALYYERIILAEESFLAERFGQAYFSWAARVPVFLPRFRGWERPALAFSFRSVLRREYPTWLGAVLVLAAIDLGADRFGGEVDDDGWVTIAGLAVLAYLVLHLINRGTRLLRVPGR